MIPPSANVEIHAKSGEIDCLLDLEPAEAIRALTIEEPKSVARNWHANRRNGTPFQAPLRLVAPVRTS